MGGAVKAQDAAVVEEGPLTVRILERGACLQEMAVEVAWDAVLALREEVVREVARVARVPGFRVGHAPLALVTERYAGRVREETVSRVVLRHLPKALHLCRIDPLGDPEVSRVHSEDGSPFTFTARCEVMPSFSVRPLRDFKAAQPDVSVTEREVEDALARLREGHAELSPVPPRPLRVGDYALVDIVCTRKGAVVERRHGVVIAIEPSRDGDGVAPLWPESSGEVAARLVGVSPGPAAITFEAPVSSKGGADPEAAVVSPLLFSVTVREVKEKQVPPLNDAFAALIGEQTVEGLRARLRRELAEQLLAHARRALEADLLQALLDQTPFDVPSSLVQSQAARLLRQAQWALLSQGLAPDEVQARQSLLVDQSKRNALRQVKVFFLLRQVAKEQGYAATEAEVDGRLRELAQKLGKSVDGVRVELQSQRMLEEVAWEIIRGKAMDFLLAQAGVRAP